MYSQTGDRDQENAHDIMQFFGSNCSILRTIEVTHRRSIQFADRPHLGSISHKLLPFLALASKIRCWSIQTWSRSLRCDPAVLVGDLPCGGLEYLRELWDRILKNRAPTLPSGQPAQRSGIHDSFMASLLDPPSPKLIDLELVAPEKTLDESFLPQDLVAIEFNASRAIASAP